MKNDSFLLSNSFDFTCSEHFNLYLNWYFLDENSLMSILFCKAKKTQLIRTRKPEKLSHTRNRRKKKKRKKQTQRQLDFSQNEIFVTINFYCELFLFFIKRTPPTIEANKIPTPHFT